MRARLRDSSGLRNTDVSGGVRLSSWVASPCNSEHVNRELKLTVHGDLFTVTVLTADRRMEENMRSRRSTMDQSQA